MPVVKHIPLRTCIACGKIKPQREMIRLVSLSGKPVQIDIGHKSSGRGAYLCRGKECLESGLLVSRLERALHVNLSTEDRGRLASGLKELCGGEGK
jgi:uncharacterized protein